MAKTSPPVILGSLDTIPSVPWSESGAIDAKNKMRTVQSYLEQAIHTAPLRDDDGQNSPAAMLERYGLAKKIREADREVEITADEQDLLERCICAAMNDQATVILIGHLRDHTGPKLAIETGESG